MQFHETAMGKEFFLNSMPKLIRELSGIRAAIETQNKLQKEALAPPPCALCRVCARYNDGKFCSDCCDCVTNNWCKFQHVDKATNK